MNFSKATSICLLAAAMTLLLLAPPTTALMPYRASLFDPIPSFEDPFKILEQAPPLTIPKATETLALARVDWKETQKCHIITVDVPGLKKEDLKIEVDDDRVMRISGERKSEEEAEGDSWHRAERTVGRFWRQFRMPGNADVAGIKAGLENGVLRITVPKVAEEKKGGVKVIGIEEGGVKEDVEATRTKDEM